MALYRLKSQEVEAWRLSDTKINDFSPAWVKSSVARSPNGSWLEIKTSGGVALFIDTTKGLQKAEIGDWLVRSGDGVEDVCPPDVFAAIYEPVP